MMVMLMFVVGAVAMRFMPHFWNFTPIVAMLLLAGAYMKRQWLWVPVVALMASDFALNLWVYHLPGRGDQYFTWMAWLVILAMAMGVFKKSVKLPVLAGTTLASSTIFFLISNFGVWAADTLYPHTWSGLVTCFTLALPFFRGTVIGDLVYTAVFFGLYAAIEQRKRQLARVIA